MLTEEEVRAKLENMVDDPNLITLSAYRANTVLWPENTIPFVESHLEYLKNHKTVQPDHYLSNLRLMIRKR